jgi:hypothetical protein
MASPPPRNVPLPAAREPVPGEDLIGIPTGTWTFPLDADVVLLATLQNGALGRILGGTGAATVAIAVSADPVLSGLSLRFAGITLSPAWPFGVRTIGTAGTVQIQ